MPEQAGHLYPVGQVLGVALVKFRPHRKPEISEDDNTTEHVRSMQARDREVTREIRAVLRQEHVRVLDVLFFDFRDFFRGRHIEKVRTIHRGIRRIRVHGIERDLVFLHVFVVKRFLIMQVPTDFHARRESLLGEVMVPQIRLVFFERIFLNERAEVFELLRPLIDELHSEKNYAAQNGDQHVPPISAKAPHLQRRPCHHHRDRRRDQDGRIHCAHRNVQQSVGPDAGIRIEPEKNVGGK